MKRKSAAENMKEGGETRKKMEHTKEDPELRKRKDLKKVEEICHSNT